MIFLNVIYTPNATAAIHKVFDQKLFYITHYHIGDHIYRATAQTIFFKNDAAAYFVG